MKFRNVGMIAALAAAFGVAPLHAQSFGFAKTRVELQRRLPALMTLPGDTIRVRVEAPPDQADLAADLQALLETELLRDNPQLRQEEHDPAVTVLCRITSFSHPPPTVTERPNLLAGRNQPPVIPYIRFTGALSVSFQAKARNGRMLGSDNVSVNYDQEFDSTGNNASHGIMGSMASSWHRLRGSSGADAQEDNPPTPAELRAKLLNEAVHQMAEQIVNTRELVEVYLAKSKGALEEGDKQAEAGLWERALETFETAPPLTKKNDDAYRLYDIGVAYEALGYQADNSAAAMKMLDQAAINYGKAIDARPGEKYFLEPQKRIEVAIAHYRKLEDQQNAPPPTVAEKPAPPTTVADNAPPSKPASSAHPHPHPRPHQHPPGSGDLGQRHTSAPARTVTRSLTNAQVVAMVKAGMDDDTIARTVRTARSVDFDLSSGGQRGLTGSGVSHSVLVAMKERAARELATGQ